MERPNDLSNHLAAMHAGSLARQYQSEVADYLESLAAEKAALVSHIDYLECSQIRECFAREVTPEEEVYQDGGWHPFAYRTDGGWVMLGGQGGGYQAHHRVVARKRQPPRSSEQQLLDVIRDVLTDADATPADFTSAILEHFEVKKKEGGE